MNTKMKYQRSFLIFSTEDTGYGTGQEPSGYVKMEANEGKGKLLASVQNLTDNRGLVYKLYIFKCNETQFSAVYAGEIPLNRNRGELKWEFNVANVDGSGIPMQEFNVAAVIGEDKNSGSKLIICPMAAYKNGKVLWRDRFRSNLRDSAKLDFSINRENKIPVNNMEKSKDNLKEDQVVSKYEYDLESKYVSRDEFKSSEIPIPSETMLEEERISDIREETWENTVIETSEELENPEEPTTGKNNERQMGDTAKSDYDEYQEMLKNLEIKERQIVSEDNEEGCQLGNSGFCRPLEGKNEDNPCKKCQARNAVNTQSASPAKKVGNIDKLRLNLDKFFETYDPFSSRRRDYRWWKIGSPVQLNNILYQCDIKTPLLFNPSLMMAHFKYRHLIVGIYSDRARRREYIVCGVPGVFNVDERPFGNMCRWAQVEGSRPRHGAFGYWLVYIDAKTGKFLSVG